MSRAAEITYYDEFGVAPDASQEQIRECFRALVRLLHPDQQTDRQLKEIAELQMRRINRIYSVLSDPERRRRYDDSLEEDDRSPTIVFSPARNLAVSSKLIARLLWAGAAVVIVAVLIVLAWDSPSTIQAPAYEHAPTPAHAATGALNAPESAEEILQLKSDLRVVKAERDAALRELVRLRDPNTRARTIVLGPLAESNASVAQPVTPSTITELPTSLAAVAPPASVSALPKQQARFAGFWFYTRPPQGQHNKNRALYPPEFIEASITEQNGTVHGRYRSRYQIVDRPISPDVNFEFSGMANGPVLKCPFTGPGGARGELTLQLTGDNSMSVEWTARELGSTQGLMSGTAKLTRRVD